MTTRTWHADEQLLTAYTAGQLPAVEAASVEQHLTRCAECRSAIRPLTDLPALDQAWAVVRERVERPPLPAPIRVAQRLGLPEPAAVLLASTTALRTAWLSSVVVALGFAVGAVLLTGGRALWPFLLVAPLIPVIGVATAYRPSEDPLEALVITAPYGRTRLILLRTCAVLVACLPFAAALGLALPGPPWVAVAWLGPALMLLPVLMALASFVGPRPASAVVALGWSAVVAGSVRHLSPTWPVEAPMQMSLLVLALGAAFVLAGRSRATRRNGAVL